MPARIVLGSTSPRRKDLLAVLGLSFDVIAPRTEEVRRPGEAPHAYVERNAKEKAHDVATQAGGDAVVIAGDTIVVLNDEILEKPLDRDDACRMLGMLSGNTHVVWSGVCVQRGGENRVFSVKTAVSLKRLSPEEIAWYVSTGEPLDKAGSYAAQGIGSYMVERIDGSYTNVVGLPTAELAKVLETDFAIPLWQNK